MRSFVLAGALALSMAGCASFPADLTQAENDVTKVSQTAPSVGQEVGQVASDLVSAAIALTGPITAIVSAF